MNKITPHSRRHMPNIYTVRELGALIKPNSNPPNLSCSRIQ